MCEGMGRPADGGCGGGSGAIGSCEEEDEEEEDEVEDDEELPVGGSMATAAIRGGGGRGEAKGGRRVVGGPSQQFGSSAVEQLLVVVVGIRSRRRGRATGGGRKSNDFAERRGRSPNVSKKNGQRLGSRFLWPANSDPIFFCLFPTEPTPTEPESFASGEKLPHITTVHRLPFTDSLSKLTHTCTHSYELISCTS